MHHLAAFYASLAQNASYAQLSAVADGGLSQNSSGQYISPANVRVLASMLQGLTLSAGQIQSPSLRNLAYPELYPPVLSLITATADGQGYQVYGENGPRLLSQEAFGVYASENNTGACPAVAGLWIAERLVSAPPGPQITLRASSTITTVAQAWALGTLTFNTQLAAGEYTVTGLNVIGDNSNFARLVFPGGTNWRPGCPVLDTYGEKDWWDRFRFGRVGQYGRFLFNTPPQLEVFGSAAASTPFTILMDVVKTG